MRIGIYAGRHSNGGGGIAVYTRSLIHNVCQLLQNDPLLQNERHRFSTLVVYADDSIITPSFLGSFLGAFLGELEQNSVPSCFKHSGLLEPIASVLGSGERTPPQVLFRRLPRLGGRFGGLIFDQLFLGRIVAADKLRLLHATGNCGLFACKVPQLVTVHDLFQAFPPAPLLPGQEEKDIQGGAWGRPRRSAIFSRIYRIMFRRQFKRAIHVITDTRAVAEEVHRRYNYPRAAISVIPLGLDESMHKFWKLSRDSEAVSELSRKWSHQGKPAAGFVLLLASSDPRKNLRRSLEAWMGLPELLQARGLVINYLDSAARRTVQTILGGSRQRLCVHEISWLSRVDVPELMFHAGVLLAPTLSEGFGLPALEASSLGTSVVSGPLESVGSGAKNVFHCNPYEVATILRALESALGAYSHLPRQDAGEIESSLSRKGGPVLAVSPQANGTPRPRIMSDACDEVFTLYRKLSRASSNEVAEVRLAHG